MGGAVGKQGVERIDADGIGALASREFEQTRQIGEIAHAGIARRAQAIELGGNAPGAPSAGHARRQMALRGRHDQRGRGIAGGAGETEPVVAHRQGRQGNGPALDQTTIDFAHAGERERCEIEGHGTDLTIFEMQAEA